MSFTRAAIDKDRITWVVVLLLLISGWQAFTSMPRAESPSILIRTAVVTSIFPGASAERVEQLVTEPLEAAIQAIPELDSVTSTSRPGVSIVQVNLRDSERDLDPIWDDLRRRVDGVEGDLPDDVIGPTVNDEFGLVFGSVYGITGEGYSFSELLAVAEDVRDTFLSQSEVSQVEIFGAQEERIFIEYDNARLSELGLSPLALTNVIQQQNIIIPGGTLLVGPENVAVEPSGNFRSVDELRELIVSVGGGVGLVRLGDIARIERGYVDPPDSMARVNGDRALTVSVSLRPGGNVSTLGTQLREAVRGLEASHPIGVEFHELAFEADDVDRSVSDFTESLIQSVVIVLLVMLAFLGVRTGLVVASLIPSTILVTFWVMSLLDVGIDQVSLAGLLIALGMLVDNAIVMSESILVGMREGKSARDAAIETAQELQLPLLTSALTTCAAFLPIFLAESTVGEFTASLFIVVTVALIASWAISLGLVTLLCVRFLKAPAARDDAYDSRFYRWYRSTLGSVLQRRWLFLGSMVLLLVLSFGAFRWLPFLFFPASDRPQFTGDLDLVSAASIEENSAQMDRLDAFIRERLLVSEENPEPVEGGGLVSWVSFVGGGGPSIASGHRPGSSQDSYTSLVFNTSSEAAVEPVMAALRAFAADELPDAQLDLRKLELGPPVGRPVSVRFSSSDPELLFEAAEAARSQLRSIPGTVAVGDDWGLFVKTLQVEVDQSRARRAGVSSQDVAISLQTALSGLSAGEYRENDDVIPITLRSESADRRDLAKLDGLSIYNQQGRSVSLRSVADWELEWQPARVLRRDRQRTITVEAGVSGTTAAEVIDALRPWLDEQQSRWGNRVGVAIGGESEASSEANASIFAQLPIAGLLIVLLLMVQFNSFRRTFIVLTTIPFSLIGVIWGLLAARSYFGFMTLLGIVSLAGIVINNATVLLDRIDLEIRENGLSRDKAVIEAAQRRLRPILLTTLTTVLGLVPLWYAGGMWEPMAIAIIFGLLFATLLTLGLVPTLYVLMFRA